MLYASHSFQKMLRSTLQNIKKGIEFSNSASVKTSNWFLYFKKKNPQPKAVHLSLVDLKKKKKP